MESETAPIWGNSRQRDSIVHPVDVESGSRRRSLNQNRVVYTEAKQFRRWFAWIIPCFVVANVIMFVITMYINNCPKKSGNCVAGFLGRFAFQPTKENPLIGPSSRTLQQIGALDVNKVVHQNQGWRLFSCNWLHAGVVHILVNMITLLVIGIRMEHEFGFIRIGLLYVLSGFGGSVLSALFLRSNISVGASGAVFGLLGGMLSEIIINWTIYSNKVVTLIVLVVIVAVNLAVGILPHVDNFAHVGGFTTGFLLGFVLLIRPHFGWIRRRYYANGYSSASSTHRFKVYQCILWALSLVLLIAGFIAGLIALFNDVDANKHCSWCHYISCVPTSRWSCNQQPAYCSINQIGNQWNITCSNNRKSGSYMLNNPSDSRLQSLCTQLCG